MNEESKKRFEAHEQHFTPDQPVEFLFRRASQAFWIDATIVSPDPLEIRYANPP
ncbi:hypothetical protein KSF_106460 [Reticulibacter mediterranei]|uniref:Uncharacterized protein n=1 Tax=Reticulibacter mediterranei TaxID=2778369 RepID=A0A8J3N9B9_9CHLR|nr:hypothetical protein [Reticulibacter mediterranei]GHP00599.1 hypothetical protein KSF_106460 [Reticulibacter mediterranei]